MATGGAALARWGGVRLAMAKGYAWYVGLFGVFSPLGLVVVGFVLKDKGPATATGGA